MKILIPVDFSETSINAVEKGINLAKAAKGEVNLLHVIKKGGGLSWLFSPSQKGPELDQDEAREKLQNLYEEYHDSGVKISYDSREGAQVENTIKDYCDEVEADLICMGTHGVSGTKSSWVGSNAYRLMTVATVPVIVMNKDFKESSFNKIVLPIDDSRHTREKVPQTINIGKFFNATIHILGMSPDEKGEIYNKIYNYSHQVRDFISEKGFETKIDIVKADNPANTTIKYARDVEANLISIMTEQEYDPYSLIMGPYAQQMVSYSEIPVLTSRPSSNLRGVAAVTR